MRTPQEELKCAERLLRSANSGPLSVSDNCALRATAHVALAMALMQLEQTNFIETLAKGLDS